MDRTDVHQQIRELSDKINHLNENLFNSRKIHPVEIDLIKLYVRELTAMVDQLSVLAGVASKGDSGSGRMEAGAGRMESGKGKSTDNTKQETQVAEKITAPIASQENIPVSTPTIQKEEPAPKVESGFSINIVDSEPVEAVPETTAEHTTETQKIEFLEEEPETSPPPRRLVTIQPPQPGQTQSQAQPQEHIQSQPATHSQQYIPSPEPQAATRYEQTELPKERIKPVIQLSMEAEDTEAPSINDLFAQQDKSDHYSKAKRTDTKSLKESMDLGEKFLFLKELFEGNQTAFDNATEKLSNMSSLEEAKVFVEESLRSQFAWSGKDNVVKQFYTLLEHRFKR